MEQIRTYINSLNPTYVSWAVIGFMFLTTILLAWFITGMFRSEQVHKSYNQMIDKNKELINSNLKVSKLKAFNYDELRLYITRSGLSYMTGGKMTPLGYILCRFGTAIFLMILGFQYHLILGLVLLPVGFFAMDFIINESDKGDNNKMLEDIKSIYDTLRIQTKAGVYITSVLTDCYLVVQNKRLKKALLELTSELAAKNDTEIALDNFRNKFNNSYIDTLVIIVKQSMKTGQAAKMFDDIKIQIVDIESAMLTAEQIKIKTQIIFVQILLYVAIIVVSIYIAMVGLQTGLAF